MIYHEIDGLKYIMEQKEIAKTQGQFPSHVPQGSTSYTQIFDNIEKMMNSTVHKHVVAGAASAGDGMLNDHGEDHISMVEERAYMILGERVDDLNGYEIFFLLLSIHFHDVGNLLGRDAHEEKIDEIFNTLGKQFPLDKTAQRLIRDIATSHGGNYNGNKDTISYVQEVTHIDGIKIRASLLASILRYADEIADDKNRASSFIAAVGSIPEKNKVFHEYSLSLEPPIVNGDTLNLQYYIPNKFVTEKISKNDTEVYLYDEILLRVQKCLCELEYCKKYSQGFIHISCISVSISVLSENGLKELYKDSFRLRLGGYPDMSLYEPQKCCTNPPLRANNGIELISLINKEA